jgi:uncharacterized HAD superfamily protein
MVPLNELLSKPDGAIERSPLRDVNPASVYNKPYGNRLLIVDDSSSNVSVTFTDLRKRLAQQTSLQISYGVVYRASERSKVDHFYREVPMPRMFGWNWYRHAYLKQAMLDMDGVICEDWKQRSEEDHDPEFVRHVHEAKPLYIPDAPVRAIVTSRIERYRPETVAWLAKHRVRYGQLIMHPAETPEKRRAARDHAIRKAAAYRQDSQAMLFVESDERQAAQIFELTQAPVLCVDTMTMLARKE